MQITKLTLPDEYLKAIGSVVVSWNQLETVMTMCLIRLMGREISDLSSHVIFPHISFNQRTDIIGAMLRAVHLDPDDPAITRYEKWVLPQLRNMQTKRNEIVHSFWVEDPEKGVMTSSVAARGRLKIKQNHPTVAQLDALSDEIIQAANSVFALIYGVDKD